MTQPYDLGAEDLSGTATAETARLLEAVLGHTPMLVAVLDARFNFLWVNRAYAQADEREPSFFPGKNHFALYPDAENELLFQQVVQTGVPYVAHARPFEYPGHPQRGTSYWDWSLVPIFDRDGAVGRLALTLMDVTEREQAVIALREKEELFRTLVQSQGEGTGIVDLQECFVFANPAAERIFGISPGRLVGRCLDEFVESDRYNLILEQTERRKQGQGSSYEVQIVRPDGERRILFVTATPHYDHDKQLVGTVGVFRDVTEEVQTREALQKIRQELELRVEERTAQLLAANRRLENEVGERRRAEEMLRQRNHELALIHESTQVFNSVLDLNQVLMLVLDKVRELLSATASSIWLIDRERGDLVCCQSSGRESHMVHAWRMAPGEGLVGWVAQSGESLIVADARLDRRHFHEIDRLTGLELPSIMNVALRAKDEIVGVLQVLDEKPDRFCVADLAVVEPLAISAASAIQNARLYEEAERLRGFNQNIVQSMDEGILLVNPAGKIAFVNRSMLRLLEYDSGQLLDQDWQVIVPPEYVVAAEKQVGPSVSGVAARVEGVALTREGRRVPVSVSIRPLQYETDFQGILAVFTDISERRQAEEMLRRQNQELVALNATAAAISETPDLDRVFRASLDKVIGMMHMDGGWIQLIDKENPYGSLSLAAHQGLKEEILNHLKGFTPVSWPVSKFIRLREPVVLREGGQESDSELARVWPPLWTLVAVPILARDTVLGVLAMLSYSPREIGQREVQLLTTIAHQIGLATQNLRLLQEAAEIQVLRELNLLRSELIANVSHELRTPLGLIKILTTTLLRPDVSLGPEMQREFLQDIDEETDRLEELVRNLLDISRMEEGRLHLEHQLTDLGHLAQEVIQEMHLQRTHHDIVLDFPSAPLTAWVDPRRIRQVLRNLLSNACKYSPEGGIVTVRGCQEDRQVLIQVHDQGIGIPEKDLERVFERFYRIESAQTQGVSGVGLGLPVCQGIVEAHGGRIWAESILGKGSVFSFVLPAGPAPEPAMSGYAEGEPTPGQEG